MVSDYQLPNLDPVQGQAANGVKVAGLTFGFWVFPDANIKACMWCVVMNLKELLQTF